MRESTEGLIHHRDTEITELKTWSKPARLAYVGKASRLTSSAVRRHGASRPQTP
jgi:hypothetical protein